MVYCPMMIAETRSRGIQFKRPLSRVTKRERTDFRH